MGGGRHQGYRLIVDPHDVPDDPRDQLRHQRRTEFPRRRTEQARRHRKSDQLQDRRRAGHEAREPLRHRRRCRGRRIDSVRQVLVFKAALRAICTRPTVMLTSPIPREIGNDFEPFGASRQRCGNTSTVNKKGDRE